MKHPLSTNNSTESGPISIWFPKHPKYGLMNKNAESKQLDIYCLKVNITNPIPMTNNDGENNPDDKIETTIVETTNDYIVVSSRY